jgi:hypothetical protein
MRIRFFLSWSANAPVCGTVSISGSASTATTIALAPVACANALAESSSSRATFGGSTRPVG